MPEPAPLSHQFPQAGTRCLIVRTARRTAPRLRIDADQLARTALRVTPLRNRPGRSISLQAGRLEFFVRSPFSVETSITLSTRSHFSFAFSPSRALSRRATDTSMPPHFDRHV